MLSAFLLLATCKLLGFFNVFSRFAEDCMLVAMAYLITCGSLEIRVS